MDISQDKFGAFLQKIANEYKYDLETIQFSYEENIVEDKVEKKRRSWTGDEEEASLKDNKFKIGQTYFIFIRELNDDYNGIIIV